MQRLLHPEEEECTKNFFPALPTVQQEGTAAVSKSNLLPPHPGKREKEIIPRGEEEERGKEGYLLHRRYTCMCTYVLSSLSPPPPPSAPPHCRLASDAALGGDPKSRFPPGLVGLGFYGESLDLKAQSVDLTTQIRYQGRLFPVVFFALPL